ncbi:MAG: acylphosphatase [Candidatus Omnitrophota bacterium]
MMKKEAIHVYYSGTVQGVGFRFTVERIGRQMGLTGWIKNLPDSRVEAFCEGNKKDLNLFLEKVRLSMSGYISNETVNWIEASGEFDSFEISFF